MFWWFIDSLKHFKEYDEFFSWFLLPLGNFNITVKRRDWQKIIHFLLLILLKILLGSLARWTHWGANIPWQSNFFDKITLMSTYIFQYTLQNATCWYLLKKLLPATWPGCQYLTILFAVHLLCNLVCLLYVALCPQTNICWAKKPSTTKWQLILKEPVCSTSLLNTAPFLDYTLSLISITCLWSDIVPLM